MRKLSEINKEMEEKYPWFFDCICQVKLWTIQDKNKTENNLREKIGNYARNYLAQHPEITGTEDKDGLVQKITDQIEKEIKAMDISYDKRPDPFVAAQLRRNRIPEEPENRFIRLR